MTRLAPVALTLPVSSNSPNCYSHVNHLLELLLFVRLQLLVLFDALNVKLVLGLGARGLKGTGEDSELGILYLVGHLRMGEVLVDDDTVYKAGVLKSTSDLAVDLDELKVDVTALQVGNGENRVDGNVGKLVVGDRDDLASEGSLGCLYKVASVLLAEGDGVGNAVELLNGNLTCLLVTVGDTNRVDSAVEQGERGGEESASKNCPSACRQISRGCGGHRCV